MDKLFRRKRKYSFRRSTSVFLLTLLSLTILVNPSAYAWEITTNGRNEIGDKQFIAYVGKVSRESTFLAVGCTSSTLEIKIATDVDFDDDTTLRWRFDSKKAKEVLFYEGPSSGPIRTMEIEDSERYFLGILSAKKVVIQFFTYSGAAITTTFNVSGARKLVKGLRKAGCKI